MKTADVIKLSTEDGLRLVTTENLDEYERQVENYIAGKDNFTIQELKQLEELFNLLLLLRSINSPWLDLALEFFQLGFKELFQMLLDNTFTYRFPHINDFQDILLSLRNWLIAQSLILPVDHKDFFAWYYQGNIPTSDFFINPPKITREDFIAFHKFQESKLLGKVNYGKPQILNQPNYIIKVEKIDKLFRLLNADGKIWEPMIFPHFLACFDLNNQPTITLGHANRGALVRLLSMIDEATGLMPVSKEMAFSHFNINGFAQAKGRDSEKSDKIIFSYQKELDKIF